MRQRQRDEVEEFTIRDERRVRYWAEQAFPVMLVIRTSEGDIRWMEIRDWPKHTNREGRDPVKQIVFDGVRFDVMSVRRWRGRALGLTVPLP